MLFLQAHSKLSLASHGQQQQWEPLSVVSKPLLMGCFEAHDFPRAPGVRPKPHLAEPVPTPSVPPRPPCLCFSSPYSLGCPAPLDTFQNLSTPGRLSSKAACLLLTRPSRVSLPSHLGASLSCLWLSAFTGFRSKLVVYVPGSLPGLLVPQNKD